MQKKPTSKQRRVWRTRAQMRRAQNGRLRLSVHRTGVHIYAQIIDDEKGQTLVAASTIDKDLRGKLKKTANTEAATEVGKLLGQRATKAGVKEVCFDRGGFAYHGRVKALADGAREAGLAF